MANEQIAKMKIYRLGVPFRRKFAHATAIRSVSDNVIVSLELGNGRIGFGETLAREYVTGESQESVISDLQNVYVPILENIRPGGFGEVLEFLEKLPLSDGDKPLYAARCAVELALIDVYGKYFNRNPERFAGWIDQPFWEPPGGAADRGYSGIIGSSSPKNAAWMARLMKWWGVRDFKVKVGDTQEFERLQAVLRVISPLLKTQRGTIRVDANGAWQPEELADKIDRLEELGTMYLEQATASEFDDSWRSVQHNSGVNLIADESLVSMHDAERLTKEYSVGIFNIRLAKNGGLLPSLRLAAFAYSKGIAVQVGCMVGETGILTAGGQWLANILPEIIFAEGGYGQLLLKGDIVKKPAKFNYRGRIPRPTGPGLGFEVDMKKLEKYSVTPPVVINL